MIDNDIPPCIPQWYSRFWSMPLPSSPLNNWFDTRTIASSHPRIVYQSSPLKLQYHRSFLRPLSLWRVHCPVHCSLRALTDSEFTEFVVCLLCHSFNFFLMEHRDYFLLFSATLFFQDLWSFFAGCARYANEFLHFFKSRATVRLKICSASLKESLFLTPWVCYKLFVNFNFFAHCIFCTSCY